MKTTEQVRREALAMVEKLQAMQREQLLKGICVEIKVIPYNENVDVEVEVYRKENRYNYHKCKRYNWSYTNDDSHNDELNKLKHSLENGLEDEESKVSEG